MKFIKLLNRWINMLTGKSTFHVEQGVGKFYSKTEIKGYYNDLTNKVNDIICLDENGIPVNTTIANVEAYFPITIFQYGLGLYDLYLESKDTTYKKKFMIIADWALKKQEKSGMWDCMETLKDSAHETQSSMCQGEGASVLLRAYKITSDKKYFKGAEMAIKFMLKSVDEGGTCLYIGDEVIFQEYVSKYNLSVLNGWIFSLFGLYDYYIETKNEKINTIMSKSIDTLINKLKQYDRGFWTNYDLKGTIASPTYHDLHIKQLRLLYEIFGKKEFYVYAVKWEKYQNSKIKKILSMVVKLKQKMLKNKYYDINTTLLK